MACVPSHNVSAGRLFILIGWIIQMVMIGKFGIDFLLDEIRLCEQFKKALIII